MSFIPTFGMIPVAATSYQIWYEFHTSVFAVYLFCGTERNGTPDSAKYLFCGTHQNEPKTAS